MSPTLEQVDVCLRAAVCIAQADGRIDGPESKKIEAGILNTGLVSNDAYSLCKSEHQDPDDIAKHISDLPEALGIQLMRFCEEVACVNGQVSEAEAKFFLRIFRHFLLSEDTDLWKRYIEAKKLTRECELSLFKVAQRG